MSPIHSPMRNLGSALAIGILLIAVAACSRSEAGSPAITIYKTPTCGCCAKWVDHLDAHGFKTKTTDMDDLRPMKVRLGVPRRLSSCHTAVVDGYVVEGHIPADVIMRLLEEKPDITGIAVPGMPIGSPGMEGPNPQSYDILAFSKGGRVFVYDRR